LFKSDSAESFCEKTKLRFRWDLDKFDFARANVFAKPMIFHGIMLVARCHLVRFKKAKSQGSNIISIYFDVKVDVAFELKVWSKAISQLGKDPCMKC
jgi:hypothetical protein